MSKHKDETPKVEKTPDLPTVIEGPPDITNDPVPEGPTVPIEGPPDNTNDKG